MSRGGVLFPGRGTPAISWHIPKGGRQRLLWVHGKGGGDGGRPGALLAWTDACIPRRTLSQSSVHTHAWRQVGARWSVHTLASVHTSTTFSCTHGPTHAHP